MIPSREKARGGRRRGLLSPAHPPPVPQPESPIVLIADDDETMRLVLQRALTNDGYVAIPVDDGGEIWPILDRENVVALLLDLKMPGVNGWEVLRRLRDDFRAGTSRSSSAPCNSSPSPSTSTPFVTPCAHPSLDADGSFSLLYPRRSRGGG